MKESTNRWIGLILLLVAFLGLLGLFGPAVIVWSVIYGLLVMVGSYEVFVAGHRKR